MTLAIVFFFCSFAWNTPSQMRAGAPQSAIQAAPEKQQETSNPQAQSTPPEANPSSSVQAPANSPKPAAKPKHRKKKIVSSNCGVRPTPAQSAASGTHQGASPSDAATGTSSATAGGQTSAAPPAASDCPPPKTIVRHGGTTEPSIQLEGGPPHNHAAQQRNVVNQLLGVTENNLRKVNSKQLSSTQQDTLSQTRAFMKQSRDAIADGDLDRARTLAWKAEMLSEDLIKP